MEKNKTRYYPNVFGITEEVSDRGCTNPIQGLYRSCTLQRLHDKLLTLQSQEQEQLLGLKVGSVIRWFSATLIKLSAEECFKKHVNEQHDYLQHT